MRTPIPVEEQIAAMRDDRIRVLISGAGVAGVALAQALRADGLHPVLIEATSSDADPGYMLGLMPLVEPLIREVGVHDGYMAGSVGVHRYRLMGRHGQLLREYSLDELVSEFGNYRGISRGDLSDILTPDGLPVAFETTITGITQNHDAATVCFSTGEKAEFDSVVVAEGIHSSTRSLMLSPEQVTKFDSGWGGWVAWMDADDAPDRYEELWGAGFFIGIYPVKDKVGVFVGGDRSETKAGPASFIARIRADVSETNDRLNRALAAVTNTAEPYYWSFVDCRASSWTDNRMVLLGDAAAGFLPTAGIGAGMAMESSSQLAARLLGATRSGIPLALRDYERAQRPRVESAQTNSRQLARLMFHRSKAFSVARDVAMRFVTLKMGLGPIRKLLETSPSA